MRVVFCCLFILAAIPAFAASPFSRTGYTGPSHDGHTVISQYIAMADGVRLAADVWVPEGLPKGAKVPAVLIPTRYWRDVAIRWPFNHLHESPEPRDVIRRFLVAHGYAVVSLDARGSGASFGHVLYPRSAQEIDDYRQVIDWMVAQPWCDGNIGAVGQAYEGVAAEMIAGLDHPAVKAVASQYAEFDLYTEIAFPGGIRHERLIADWSRITGSMARNEIPEEIGWLGQAFALGVKPVEGAEDELKAALADHAKNGDLYTFAKQITYRDDVVSSPEGSGSIDTMSTHTMLDRLSASGVPILYTASWYDAGTAQGMAVRLLNLKNPIRVVIGPWNKGGTMNCSPYAASAKADVSMDTQLIELVRFFDCHIKGTANGAMDAPRLIYYVVGKETWATADTWPEGPQGNRVLYLGDDQALLNNQPTADSAVDAFTVDFAATTGENNRWHTHLLGVPIEWPTAAQASKGRIAYTSPPFDADTTITGSPVMSVYLESTVPDSAIYAYLEDVAPDGTAYYLTEGQLRTLHAKTTPAPMAWPTPNYRSFLQADGVVPAAGEAVLYTFDLQPIAARIAKGHRVRLSFAGHDAGTFVRIPETGTPQWGLRRDAAHPSNVSLPLAPN